MVGGSLFRSGEGGSVIAGYSTRISMPLNNNFYPFPFEKSKNLNSGKKSLLGPLKFLAYKLLPKRPIYTETQRETHPRVCVLGGLLYTEN